MEALNDDLHGDGKEKIDVFRASRRVIELEARLSILPVLLRRTDLL